MIFLKIMLSTEHLLKQWTFNSGKYVNTRLYMMSATNVKPYDPILEFSNSSFDIFFFLRPNTAFSYNIISVVI